MYSIGSRLVSFPVQWSGTQSNAKNLINFMDNSCDRSPLVLYSIIVGVVLIGDSK